MGLTLGQRGHAYFFLLGRSLVHAVVGLVGGKAGCGKEWSIRCVFFLSFLFMMQFSFEFLQGVYLSPREGGRAPELDTPDLSSSTRHFRRLLLTMFIS